MSDTVFRAFPQDEYEALAMLYIQQKDLSEVSPKALYDMYYDAYEKIRDRSIEAHRERLSKNNRLS